MRFTIHDVGHGFCSHLVHDNGNVKLWDCAGPSARLPRDWRSTCEETIQWRSRHSSRCLLWGALRLSWLSRRPGSWLTVWSWEISGKLVRRLP